jgi:hypothetical protein
MALPTTGLVARFHRSDISEMRVITYAWRLGPVLPKLFGQEFSRAMYLPDCG